MSGRLIADPDVQILAGLAGALRGDYGDEDTAWKGSPFAWIRLRPSRQRGKIGEDLVAGWCAAKGLDVVKSPDQECDRLIEGVRTEIKFSTLWRNGGYVFQQFRDQNYRIAICLGVSPFDARCWAVRKETLFKYFRLGRVRHQHGGKRDTDTWWFRVNPAGDIPEWLAGTGGTLAQAYVALKALTGAKRR